MASHIARDSDGSNGNNVRSSNSANVAPGANYPSSVSNLAAASSSSSSFPFFLIPAQQRPQTQRTRPSFPIGTSSPSMPTVSFKAPAHKHAHHLHSIPPREKTARTLIIDHMLYLHTRARFIQARSELGMARPDASSLDDTEDVQALVFGVAGMDRQKPNTADRIRFVPHIDLELARTQRAAAEGMEKVLSSLLTQNGDLNDRSDHSGTGGRPLPSGIRLRLAISALVNDFFARDDDVYDQDDFSDDTMDAFPSDSSESPMSIASIISSPPIPPKGYPQAALTIPVSIVHLAIISSFKIPNLKSGNSLPARLPPPGSIFSSIPRGAGPESPWALGSMVTPRRSAPTSSPTTTHAPRVWKAVGRSRELYNTGIKRRHTICVRHLKPLEECPKLCVHATATPSRYSRQSLTNIGTGLSHSGPPLRRRSRLGTDDTSANGWIGARMVDLLPRFLRLSALVARELGREMQGEQQEIYDDEAASRDRPATNQASLISSSTPVPTDSDPVSTTGDARPSREWYALLSGIVTRAVLEGYLGKGWLGPDSLEVLFGLGIGVDWIALSHTGNRSNLDARPESRPTSPRPSRIGASKGTYVDNESDDNDGSISTETPSTSSVDNEEDKRFEPDSMPTLAEAAKILFGRGVPTSATASNTPGVHAPSSLGYGFTPTMWSPAFIRPGAGGGDPEWEFEMSERVSEFSTIAPQTPDLMSHLNDLSARYPPEPVERAAVRFCEAVANWRGAPELEAYKIKGRSVSSSLAQASSTTASFPSLSKSTPSPVPSSTSTSGTINILSYFVIPKRVRLSGAASSRKRQRDDTTSLSSSSATKRRNVETDAAADAS